MLNKKFIWYLKLIIVMSLFFIQTSAFGYDITDKFSIGGILAGAYQYQWVDGDDDKGLINYDHLYSGGLNITGKWYGRADDNIGIGYAYLDGQNDINYTQVAEVYWRLVLNDYVAVTVDAQYMQDKYDTDEDDIDGFILGIRGAVGF